MKDRTTEAKSDADGLQSLERWKTVQLDRAQAVHVETQQLVSSRHNEVERVRRSVDESQALAREYLSDAQILNTDALLRMRNYSTVRTKELSEANSRLHESQSAETEARGELRRKFEELSAVERLRERRSNEAAREAARREQKRLDDQALLKSAALLATEARMLRKSKSNEE